MVSSGFQKGSHSNSPLLWDLTFCKYMMLYDTAELIWYIVACCWPTVANGEK